MNETIELEILSGYQTGNSVGDKVYITVRSLPENFDASTFAFLNGRLGELPIEDFTLVSVEDKEFSFSIPNGIPYTDEEGIEMDYYICFVDDNNGFILQLENGVKIVNVNKQRRAFEFIACTPMNNISLDNLSVITFNISTQGALQLTSPYLEFIALNAQGGPQFIRGQVEIVSDELITFRVVNQLALGIKSGSSYKFVANIGVQSIVSSFQFLFE